MKAFYLFIIKIEYGIGKWEQKMKGTPANAN